MESRYSGWYDDEPEGKVCKYCEGCGDSIHEGEAYYEADGTPYCVKCVIRREAVWEGEE